MSNDVQVTEFSDDATACARLGRMVKRAREARGLSLSNVAETLHTSYQRVQRIEKGEGDPGLQLAVQLILFFELDAAALVYGQKVASLQRRRMMTTPA